MTFVLLLFPQTKLRQNKNVYKPRTLINKYFLSIPNTNIMCVFFLNVLKFIVLNLQCLYDNYGTICRFIYYLPWLLIKIITQVTKIFGNILRCWLDG